jgi:hypothetical protein
MDWRDSPSSGSRGAAPGRRCGRRSCLRRHPVSNTHPQGRACAQTHPPHRGAVADTVACREPSRDRRHRSYGSADARGCRQLGDRPPRRAGGCRIAAGTGDLQTARRRSPRCVRCCRGRVITCTIRRYPVHLIDVVQLGNRSRITVRPALPRDADLQRELTRRVRNRRLSREVRMDQQREENTSWPPGNPIRLSIPHPAWP